MRFTLSERYISQQADGSSWESEAFIDVTYKTSEAQIFSAWYHRNPVYAPAAKASGSFEAQLKRPGPSGSVSCGFVGSPDRSGWQMTIGSFGALSTPWPGFPSSGWRQTRTGVTSPDCPPSLQLNPLLAGPKDGEMVFRAEPSELPQGRLYTGSPADISAFNSALAEHFVLHCLVTSVSTLVPGYVQTLELGALTTYPNGEIYSVAAWGTVDEDLYPMSSSPLDLLPMARPPSHLSAFPPPLPNLNMLKARARKELSLPRGCVHGERRRRGQRCR